MKAFGYYQSLPIDHPDALVALERPIPRAHGHDLLVEVRAISVNPVDTKVRQGMPPDAGQARVLGWDAAGVVRAVGEQVSLFKPGDRVYYAGDLTRSGTNSELHLVDERIVGPMPKHLDFAEAAALPLTAITAWELLFDRLGITADSEGSLLILGAAGGVGSILVQLARQLTRMTVIATASRPETQAWVRDLGAHHVIDHRRDLVTELKATGLAEVTHVASLTHTDQHLDALIALLKPQGRFALIDDPEDIPLAAFKRKSLSVHWEFMFTRSMYATEDMLEQHRLLRRVADLIDGNRLRTTLGAHFGVINVENLKRAHALLESGKARGKIVLEGF